MYQTGRVTLFKGEFGVLVNDSSKSYYFGIKLFCQRLDDVDHIVRRIICWYCHSLDTRSVFGPVLEVVSGNLEPIMKIMSGVSVPVAGSDRFWLVLFTNENPDIGGRDNRLWCVMVQKAKGIWAPKRSSCDLTTSVRRICSTMEFHENAPYRLYKTLRSCSPQRC